MAGWAEAPMDRHQIVLFSPTLDAMIDEDRPVRLFDELLSLCDWSAWEGQYCLVHGQPPIHPRIVAGVILYGLSRGMRSSRVLEYALSSNLDFLWLAEGRQIDHSTICGFRKQFGEELKKLFREVFAIAMRAGLARLECVALDATRTKANSSRHATATAATLEERLAGLDEQVEQMLREAEEADERDRDLFGQSTPNRLSRELADLKRRQKRLRKAHREAQKKDAARKPRKGEKVKPCAVPVADPDATIQPNKDGGQSPNFTPVSTTETHGGYIADTDVLAGGEDPHQVVETVERIEQSTGEKPQRILADSLYDSGEGLAELEAQDVEPFIPLQQRPKCPDNPGRRDDPTEPVAEADWPRLPRSPKTRKLDRSAFVYDAGSDRYFCPMGRELPLQQVQNKPRKAGPVETRVYWCDRCAECPLRGECLSGKAKRRTISRDAYEERREAMDRRLASPRGRRIYGQRKWAAETPFAILKEHCRLRQFLLRGLDNVRTEWLWACTAFNLSKLVRDMARLRRKLAA